MPAISQLHDPKRFYDAATEIVFLVALGVLFTHELDAVLNYEWRVIPLLRSVPDHQGAILFIAFHIPLFAGIVAAAASQNHNTRRITRLAICAFLLVHAGLHFIFSSDPAYEFDARLSDILIYGGAVLGAAYLLLARFVSSANRAR